ncbi:MAG: ISNCY family transposase [Desulfobacterales bacterium]|nr:ISNCY family transposase [Desulfobacterales bacterium]
MKGLTFDSIIQFFHKTLQDLPDVRTGANTSYAIEDAALAAFSVFFTQSPSFLAFQKSMQQSKGKNNAQSLFGVLNIPSDNQIKNLLDPISPDYLFPVFSYIFHSLNDLGYLDTFRSYNGNLLLALDGVQYFSSKSIHCENCNQKQHRNGTTTYYHTAITPVIAAPGNNKVISLQPEFITPQDGHKKQDCENAAAKRWICQHSGEYSQFGCTILGDDLYCKQPLCKLMIEQEFDFILVCKPDSHKTLYQWIEGLDSKDIDTQLVKRWTGKRHEIDTYRFVNQVPLKDAADALHVNWCEMTTKLEDGKIIYKNAFATNFKLHKENVEEIVANGRARWKVENENNNVLKNRGYHLGHNFGHGKKKLSSILATFNLLAFLLHTFLEQVDKKYKLVRDTLPARQTFFDDIRALTRYMYFDNWEVLLDFMIRGLELEPPDTS